MAAIDLSKISLVRTLVMNCLIHNNDNHPIVPEDIVSFTHNVYIGTAFNQQQKTVSINVSVGGHAVNKDNESLGATAAFEIHFDFLVENLEDLLIKHSDTSEIIPDTTLGMTLVGIAYSTARGIILSKIADTFFQGFALPLRTVPDLLAESEDRKRRVLETLDEEEQKQATASSKNLRKRSVK